MKTIFTFLIGFSCIFSYAQNILVLNKKNNNPIAGVLIYNPDKTKSTVSNLDGSFSIDSFEPDETIIFQHIAFNLKKLTKAEISNIVFLTSKSHGLDEVVISVSKFEQSKKEVPQKIISFNAEDIQLANPQTSADLLENTGQIFIQKSQQGGGSPMIRGFSTNRLLLTVDGVRMNNAIFRGGNLQNVISIDPFSIRNTEIILGSGSVIYGSDAIGGVMNFYTKNPLLSGGQDLYFDSNIVARYSSVNNEKTAHADVNFGFQKWAFLSSISFTDFDDLKMGKIGPDDYLRLEYVNTTNNGDEIIQNENPRVQKYSGYNQINFMQKALYKSNSNTFIDLGLHYTATSEYPRYDRLIRYSDGQLRSAEWNYGPQKWFMANAQLTRLSSASSLHDKIKLTAAYQNYQESRIDRNLFSDTRRTRKENVDILSANIDFEKKLSENSIIFYGLEYIYNKVGSSAYQENISTRTQEPTATRYPDDSKWQSMAAYMSYKYKPNTKFTVQSGIRYNHIVIDADLSANNTYYNLPYDKADINTGALTGTAGLSWIPNKIIQWKFNASTAFRAPNIDDIGKVFDSEPGSVVIPNPNLKPEYAYGGELATTLNFGDLFIIDLSTYYTYLDNALVRRDYAINGSNQMYYDGELSDVQAIQNASKAWIYGFEAGIKINFSQRFRLLSQYSFIGGTEEDENRIEVPIRHVAPAFGNTHFVWNNDKLKLNAFINFNGEISNNQLAPNLADYLFAKDSNGNPYAPSWYTLNFRSQYKLNKHTTIAASLENITNQRYRTYSSGIAAAGTNLILSVNYNL